MKYVVIDPPEGVDAERLRPYIVKVTGRGRWMVPEKAYRDVYPLGLGDYVALAIEFCGLHHLARLYTRLTGKPCRCAQRQAALNRFGRWMRRHIQRICRWWRRVTR